MLIALPPIRAYRADTAAAPHAELPDDASWLTLATQLSRAARVTGDSQIALLADLARDAGQAVPADERELRDLACAVGVRAATAMEDGARFHLAFTVLSGVLVLLDENAVRDRGLVLAQQGRIARQLGEQDEARRRYELVESLGEEFDVDELRARAWIGYGVLAEVRGNYPDVRKWSSRVLTLEGLPLALRRLAHQSLTAAALAARDFDLAAVHAWSAFEGAAGDGEAVAMIALGEVFIRAGHPRTALRSFGAALLRPLPPRLELPALGGAAVAAARALPALRARPLVERYAVRIQELVAGTQLPWANVTALADIGDAYSALGAQQAAATVRQQARTVAERHSFFELLARLETAESRPALMPVATLHAAAAVADAVESFHTSEEVTAALAGVGS